MAQCQDLRAGQPRECTVKADRHYSGAVKSSATMVKPHLTLDESTHDLRSNTIQSTPEVKFPDAHEL